MVDLSCDAVDVAHAAQITAIRALDGFSVLKVSDRTFLLHLGGKIEVTPKVSRRHREDLSRAYTPGSPECAPRSPRTRPTPGG